MYTPAGRSRKAKLPVMVWIHGGGLAAGRSRDYDPTPLVRDDTVVVTINYRLGALGFLAHPALPAEAGGSSGNYGLLDQQAALRWVQRNIGNFGGDGRKVTIFGESAGGLSVLAQMASPRAAGLFSRAIVQSGAYALMQQSQRNAHPAGRRFAAAVGCPTQAAGCLRSVPVRRLLAKQDQGYEPTIDGRVLTRSISTALARGQFQRVPLMNGTTADEWRLMVALSHDLVGRPVTARTYRSAIAAAFGVRPATAAAIAARYPLSTYPSPALALAAAGTDGIFACTARKVNQLASRYVPTYAYEFADRRAPQRLLLPVAYPYGAYHAAEIQYLFDLPTAPRAGRLNRAQQQLARTMRAVLDRIRGHRRALRKRHHAALVRVPDDGRAVPAARPPEAHHDGPVRGPTPVRVLDTSLTQTPSMPRLAVARTRDSPVARRRGLGACSSTVM